MSRLFALAAAGVIAFALTLVVTTATEPQRPPPHKDPSERLDSPKLGGKERLRLHLSTDKPLYKPGETLWMRALAVDAHDGTPLPQHTGLGGQFTITDPQGATVATIPAGGQLSVLGGSWAIPDAMAGGRYTIAASTHFGDAISERTVEIRTFRPPRLRSQIAFLKEGYAPGDVVQASLETTRATGGAPTGAKVTIIARIDGQEVHRQSAQVDPKGRVSTAFTLPSAIERGDGSLAFVIDDGSGIETAAKTLPIILNKLDIGLFPEGGDLVAGVENRLYIQARRLDGKPADLKGRFVDANGRVFGTIATDHEGRGLGTLIPPHDEPLLLAVDSPEGIEPLALPPALSHGVALQTLDQVTGLEAPVRLRLTSPTDTTVRCILSKIEQEIATLKIELQAGVPYDVTLTPPGSISGVLIATITDLDDRPLAERLLLRRPRSDMRVELEGPEQVIPGQQVTLSVTTTGQSYRGPQCLDSRALWLF